jgi:hypothetical protein
MSAAEDAINNMVKAGAMECQAPSGTATCPEGRIRIGVFFDGTGNNMWRDWPNGENNVLNPTGALNGPTNIAKLWRLYIERPDIQKRVYHHGVGTDSWGIQGESALPASQQSTTADGALDPGTPYHAFDQTGEKMGYGGKERTTWALKTLSEFFSKNTNPLAQEKLVESYGFSRGAAIARDFLNRVILEGVDNLKDKSGTRLITYPATRAGPARTVSVAAFVRHERVILHFLGAFDTVAAFTGAGDFNFFIDHTKVKHTVHMMAEDETRFLFPVTSLFMDPKVASSQNRYQFSSTMVELWYPGVHSDVGGCYLIVPAIPAVPATTGFTSDGMGGGATYDVPEIPEVPIKRPELAHIPLADMHKASVDQGVPLRPLSALPSHLWVVPPELKTRYEEYDAYRTSTGRYGIGQQYIHNLTSAAYGTEYFDRRALQPSVIWLRANYMHDERGWYDRDRHKRDVLYMGPQPLVNGR